MKKTAKKKGPIPPIKTGKRLEAKPEPKTPSILAVQAAPARQPEIRTDVDKLLELVERKGEVQVKELANELKLPLDVVEEICEALQTHNLLEVKYSIMRGGVARRISK